MKTIKFICLIAVPVLILSCNMGRDRNRNNRNNQQDQDRMKTQTDTVSRGSMFFNFILNDQDKDEDFIKEAISSGMMEIELGKLAEEKASNKRVKSFGRIMVNDHSKSGEELRAIASSKNINSPASMDDKHNKIVRDLQNKGEGDFDKAYIREMVSAHDKDIDLYKKQAEDGNDPELKSFASKNLPVLLMHRDSVQNIQKDLR